MRLIVMRHASTQGNLERRYVGRSTDEPLCKEGWAQCAAMTGLPHPEVVYTSPLLRARQTATACFPDARITCVKGLEEFDFGIFEGRSAQEMEHDHAYRAWVDSGCLARCPGGESRAEYVARSNAALAALLRAAATRGEEQVVVVAHGGTIMAAFDAYAPSACGNDGYFAWHVGPCEGYAATVRLLPDEVVFEDVAPLATSRCR
jgi:alpha-ribazole phosphatase